MRKHTDPGPDPCFGCRNQKDDGRCRKMDDGRGNVSRNAHLYAPREDCPGRELPKVGAQVGLFGVRA